jgi:hypothetical protein
MSGSDPIFLFISLHPELITIPALLMVVSCMLYGFIKSFTIERHTILSISFFVVIIASILLLIGTGTYQLADSCLFDFSACLEPQKIISVAPWLLLIIASFFVNLLVGFIGIVLGTLLFSPIEWILEQLFSISIKNSFRN